MLQSRGPICTNTHAGRIPDALRFNDAASSYLYAGSCTLQCPFESSAAANPE